MRDVYPPRIDLDFKLVDQEGNVLREGKRVLRDPGYLSSGANVSAASGSLYYDKALLRRWLRRGPDKL